MRKLPASTVFNRRIPKQKFYDELQTSNRIVRLFIEQVDTIYWTHKFASDTLNLPAGKEVLEIQVIELNLKGEEISRELLALIDREIPYHLVFVTRYQGYGQFRIAYKDKAKNRVGKFKVNTYYKSEWLPHEQLDLELEGLNLDQVYENLLLQIAGQRLTMEAEENLAEAIHRNQEIERLQNAVVSLENKIKREKQFNRQVQLNGQLRTLKTELLALQKGKK